MVDYIKDQAKLITHMNFYVYNLGEFMAWINKIVRKTSLKK